MRTERETSVGHKVFLGQPPVELEPFTGVGRLEGRVVPGAIGRRARIDWARERGEVAGPQSSAVKNPGGSVRIGPRGYRVWIDQDSLAGRAWADCLGEPVGSFHLRLDRLTGTLLNATNLVELAGYDGTSGALIEI